MGVVEKRWQQAAEAIGFASARDMFRRWPESDKKLSDMLGWSPEAVSARRRVLGLQKPAARKRIDWGAEARRLGYTDAVHMLSEWDGEWTALAREIGCHPVTIYMKRKALL